MLRQLITAARALVVCTVLLGVGYPLVITLAAQVTMPSQANGSMVDVKGRSVGSRLIAQSFTDDVGQPLPGYFQPRPSAADYDGAASGGSNLGPTNPQLVAQIAQRRRQVAQFNDVPVNQVPPDAVTASSSGLDPDISPAYALLQVERVARARHLTPERVRGIVESSVQPRQLGFLGQPRVNVLQLNLALDTVQ